MSTFHHCCAKIRGFSSTETAIEPDATTTPFDPGLVITA